ncbi:hypothetical protein [Mycobacterium sp. SMC-4]|uniref:hypothetical protein n=1 Tax=Mycobacterium sp. SMC-4 TaxID=2857059 RepID=UPI0021B36F11|nr:hypothetical protein [Mycobacterium sp. SMC-4]UXA19514.1 hypothetical protein KXD98_07915 [Mycobacterium sp. SMC-4]
MANAGALINEGLWRKDKEFQKVPRLAQCTFCQVLSGKDLDTAGVMTFHLDLLAKGCDELTVEQLKEDFAALEDRRFLFVDYDTDELFIRSYVRLVSVKNRNSWLSVPKNARMVASEKIRHELAMELRRLKRKDATELADEIDPVPTPSGPGGNPVETTSQPGTPSEPRRDGDSQVLVPVLVSPSVVGSVGVQRARPNCSKHETDADENCRACMRRRLWDEEHAADELERQRDKRAAVASALQAAIDACRECDEEGWRYDDRAVKCTHPAVAHG